MTVLPRPPRRSASVRPRRLAGGAPRGSKRLRFAATVFIFFFLLLSCGPAEAQFTPPEWSTFRTHRSLKVDPKDDDIVYVGVEYDGLYQSTDSGETWRAINEGILFESYGYGEFYDLDVGPEGALYVSLVGSPGDWTRMHSRYNGVYKSIDGGQTWEHKVHAGFNTSLYTVVADPVDPEVVYAGSNGCFADDDDQLYFNTVGLVYKSIDGGDTWTELPTGFDPQTYPCQGAGSVVLDPQNPTTLFAGVYGKYSGSSAEIHPRQFGVLRSDDGGEAWRQINQGLPPNAAGWAVMRLEGSKTPPFRMLAYTNDAHDNRFNLHYSTDGLTWRDVEASLWLLVFKFHPSNSDLVMGYDYTDGSVHLSRDGGMTWEEVGRLPTEPRVSDLEWSRQSEQVIYAAGGEGTVYRSRDQGQTWIQVKSRAAGD